MELLLLSIIAIILIIFTIINNRFGVFLILFILCSLLMGTATLVSDYAIFNIYIDILIVLIFFSIILLINNRKVFYFHKNDLLRFSLWIPFIILLFVRSNFFTNYEVAKPIIFSLLIIFFFFIFPNVIRVVTWERFNKLFIKLLISFGFIQFILFVTNPQVSIVEIWLNPQFARFEYAEYLNPIWLARTFSIAAIASLIFLNGKVKVSFYIFFVLATVLTASRGPLLVLMIISLIYYIVNYKNKINYIKFSISLILSVFVITFLYLTNIVGEYFTNIFLRSHSSLFEAFFNTNKVGGRGNLLLESINLIKSNLIFGIGTGRFKEYTTILYPHNLMLEIFVELGLIGFILFILAISLRNWRINKSPYIYLVILSSGNALLSGDINGNKEFFLFLSLMLLHNNIIISRYKQKRINGVVIN
ncbi:hypothetical protein CVD28_08840 [Bacillus sp. M6-12]|uniref:O-antigen ligase family protein n=1 Tax=Bacillus sp. M6-12 TaxID=2054166 RepID=UPI000C761CC6|nr:O-antigen ligase family protein [Bacillus sp. M6-12]PLS17797.1 hypothetical protein CVD28_08840 [Bacillus sp. M6-12]